MFLRVFWGFRFPGYVIVFNFIPLKIYLLLLAINFFKHAKDNFVSHIRNLLFMFWIVSGCFSPNTMDLPKCFWLSGS